MKKTLTLILAAVLLFGICSATAETPKTEVIVFAAASLTESLTQIEALYEAAHPEIDLIFNFDSSGTLKTQIQEGAVCDVFISAAPKQMNQLDISKDEEKNPDRLDFVLEGSRTDLRKGITDPNKKRSDPNGSLLLCQCVMLRDSSARLSLRPPALRGVQLPVSSHGVFCRRGRTAGR